MTVQCFAVREALSALLDGEGADLPTALLDVHLGGCASCRAWVAGARALMDIMAPSAMPVELLDPEAVIAVIAEGGTAGAHLGLSGRRGSQRCRRPLG